MRRSSPNAQLTLPSGNFTYLLPLAGLVAYLAYRCGCRDGARLELT